MLWTLPQAKRVHAWRRQGGEPIALDKDGLFAEVKARVERRHARPLETSPNASVIANAIARYSSKAPSSSPLDVSIEATVATLLSSGAADEYDRLAPLVDLWFATSGPAFAFRALFRHGQMEKAGAENAYDTRLREVPHRLFVGAFVGAWKRFRERLTEVDEGAYKGARDVAAGVFGDAARAEGATRSIDRALIAYAFPLESTWAHTVATEPCDPPMQKFGSVSVPLPPIHLAALISSIEDPAVVHHLLETHPMLRATVLLYDHLFTAVDRMGDGATSLLPVFAKRATHQERLDLVEAFSGLPSRSRAEVLVGMLGDARTDSATRQALARDPFGALAALAEAIGKERRRAKILAPALTELATKYPNVATEVGAAAGEGARAALAPWIGDEDLLRGAGKGGKKSKTGAKPKGPWLDRAALPRPSSAQGNAMSEGDLDALIEDLRRTKIDAPLAAIGGARERWTAESLEALAFAIFDAWVAAGGPSSDAWAVNVLALLGHDGAPRKLGGMVRKWGRDDALRAALLGLDVLAEVPSNQTLLELHKLTASRQEIAEVAEQKVARLLSAKGFTEEDLFDRRVPSCSVGSTLILDYGTRTFEVRFDEHLVPSLVGPNQTLLANLPRATKSDDAAKARAAAERWKDLKEQIRDTIAGETKRFEAAMCGGRRFTVSSFREAIVGHPVLGRLARRLVWASFDGDHVSTFRVAEDGSFADGRDESTVIRGSIGIPHPLYIEEERETWGRIFGDYRIVELFPQLGRDTYRLTDAERSLKTLPRFEKIRVEPKTPFVLEAKGWSRVYREGDGGFVMQRELWDGEHEATLAFVDSAADDLTIARVSVDCVLATLDPVAVSELLRDIERTRL